MGDKENNFCKRTKKKIRESSSVATGNWDIKIALYQICALLQWREGKAISIVRLCDWRIEMGCTRSESQLLKEDKLYWTKDSTVLLVIMRSLAKKECKFGAQTKHDTPH